MGFGIQQLRASSAEKAKEVVAEAKQIESSPEEDSPVPSASAPATGSPFAAPAAAQATTRPNVFARPGPTPTPSPQSPPSSRPSFAAPQRPEVPTSGSRAPSRPSFSAPSAGPSTPNVATGPSPSRPAFAPSQSLPQVRGAFVRDPSKMGAPISSAQSNASPVSKMTPQALFEIVCTHRKLSEQAIEAAKSQARNNPDVVMAQMRRIYDQEIAPNRNRHTADLPSARALHADKVVFLLRKDDKERIRVMTREDALSTGEFLLDGATVENIHAAASPFVAPSRLFTEPDVAAPVEESEAAPVQVQAPLVHRSPKP